MNTLVKAIVLSLSAALVTAPAMAAPQDHQHYNDRHAPTTQHYKNQNHQPSHPSNQQLKKQHQPNVNKKVNPSRDWKVGQKVPSQYRSSIYKIDHKHMKKLNKPAKNQQWIKVNGDYVLINTISHAILKIING